MAINLVRKYSRKIKNGESIVIPLIFRQEYLLISAKCQNCRNTWYRAGYLSQIVDIFPLKNVQLSNKIIVPLNNPQIQSFAYFNEGYKLKFEAVNWIDFLTLEIYLPNMSLFQSESSSVNPSDITGQSDPKEITLTAVVVSVMAANPSRKALLVRNKGNKMAYLGFKNTITAANAPYAIPGGTTLEKDDDFAPGELFMVAPAGNTDIVITESY
jgi:hypothetical protein